MYLGFCFPIQQHVHCIQWTCYGLHRGRELAEHKDCSFGLEAHVIMEVLLFVCDGLLVYVIMEIL